METMTGLERWEAHYMRLLGLRPGEPEAIRALRAEAFSTFAMLGFPTTGHEEWRLTSVAPIAAGDWETAKRVNVDATAVDRHRLGSDAAAEIVFVNGFFAPDLSRLNGLESGVTIKPMCGQPGCFERELELLGTAAHFRDRAFVALNTATFQDGLILDVEAGRRAGTVHVLFLTIADGSAVIASPRVLVRAARGSAVSIVETHAGEGRYFSNGVTEVFAGEGSVVDHYKIVDESESAFHIGSLDVVQARDSVLRTRLVGLGGRLVRNDVSTHLGGEGANCSLDGLYVLRDSQHFDAHTKIVHASPHTESLELYKGILDGASRGIFNGLIVVRPDAQKITSRQTNHNLVLSNEAVADSNPQLEIHADDVKCNHGSTIGQIDQAALFYLRSRGIGEQEARGMLTLAFAGELVDRIGIASIRRRLETFLLAVLPSAGKGPA